MKTVKNRIDAINYIITASGMRLSDIADKAGISRPQIYRWKNREVQDIQTDSLNAVADALGYTIHHVNNTLEITRKGAENMDTKLLINAQMKLIVQYEEKIKIMENKIAHMEKMEKKMEKIPVCRTCLEMIGQS